MKNYLLNVTILFVVILTACNNPQKKEYEAIDADELVANIDKYTNSKVETEGEVIHVCGVDGGKIKLKTPNGAIIKIVPKNPNVVFDKSYTNKRIRVKGVVAENRITETYVDSIEKTGTLLCHIDNTPCKDEEWVAKKIKTGADIEISKRTIARLRDEMHSTQKKYISVVTIILDDFELFE